MVGLGLLTDNFKTKNYGLYLSAGTKFISKKQKPNAHPLAGLYLKPEVSLGAYRVYYKNAVYEFNQFSTETKKMPVFYGSFVACVGKQKVFKKGTVIDVFIGGGVGAARVEKSNIVSRIRQGNFIPFPSSFETGAKTEVSIALKTGLYVGYLLKSKKKKQ